jgi:hypothetical protein
MGLINNVGGIIGWIKKLLIFSGLNICGGEGA